jgi:hypothetical protein
MFSANSPKLPIGTTFEATIEPSPKGSALILNINPSSVRLIESVEELSEVAPTPCQERSLVSPTPCQERSQSVSPTPRQGRSLSVSPTPTQNKPPSQPEEIAASPAHLSELLQVIAGTILGTAFYVLNFRKFARPKTCNSIVPCLKY